MRVLLVALLALFFAGPAAAWEEVWDGSHVSNWDHGTDGQLIQGPGSISQDGDTIRVTMQKTSNFDRAELQSHNFSDGGSAVPSTRLYVWQQRISSRSQPSGGQHINQFHTDDPCYTGGIQRRDGGYIYRVRAGNITSFGNGCGYSIDRLLPIGDIRFDTWQTIEVEARWVNSSSGYLKVWVDGNLNIDYSGPTASSAATKQKFRLGHYGRAGEALVNEYRSVKVYKEGGDALPPPDPPAPLAEPLHLLKWKRAQIVKRIDAVRSARGLRSLRWGRTINRAAKKHALLLVAVGLEQQGQAAIQTIGHGRLKPGTGEVLLWKYNAKLTPKQIVRKWMNSKPHRRVLLGNFHRIGGGVAASGGHLTVAVFRFR